jgi:glycosyltransferase involved in cell wall biosynthesis
MAYPIVYFGNDWSAENRTSSHHIAARLAARHPLLYVDCPGLRAPQASGRDLKKLWRKLVGAARPPRQVGPQMWQMVLPQLPFRRLPFAALANRVVGAFLVRRAMRYVGMKQPLIWFTVPHPGVLLGQLGERFSVYYCVDDYSALPGVEREAVRSLDQALTRGAGQVFVTSLALEDAKRDINPSVTYSPHGVDVEHFGHATAPDLPVAAPLRGLMHPVIGFFGLIEGWLDLDLVEHLARARPSWSFVLVGRVAVDVSRLRALGNVHFPGPQPYSELPAWAKAFDVAIYPGGNNDFVKNANPLKIREYLATGKPVVSVWSREIERLASVVRTAKTRESFLEQIEDALTNDTTEARAARRQSVAAMSWEARVEEVERVVEARMEQQ